jgi:starvation-inducible DNA-binding protein
MLADNLKVLLGTTYALYFKITGFHWNVEGSNFPQYHEFLNNYYDEVYATADTIAEYVRSLDVYAPGSMARMLELSVLQEQPKIPRAELMFTELLQDTEALIEMVKSVFDEATGERQQGIANFMADLQDLYSKKRWMIRSILKTDRE